MNIKRKEKRLNTLSPFFSRVMRLLCSSMFKPHGSSSNKSLPAGPAAQIIEWVMSLFHRAVLRVLSALVYKPSAKSQIGTLSVCVFMKVGYPSLGLSAHINPTLFSVQCVQLCILSRICESLQLWWPSITIQSMTCIFPLGLTHFP